jgi:hypothetical protein
LAGSNWWQALDNKLMQLQELIKSGLAVNTRPTYHLFSAMQHWQTGGQRADDAATTTTVTDSTAAKQLHLR